MAELQDSGGDEPFIRKAVEAAIRIGLIVLLLAWCFEIFRPFVIPVIWGIIIAIASFPGYRWLGSALGGRHKTAAFLITLLALVVLILPAALLAETLANTAQGLSGDLEDGSLTIPEPPESLGSWFLIGEPLERFWHLATTNLQAALKQIEPQLKAAGGWLLKAAASAGFGLLQFIFAIIIAGVILAHSQTGYGVASALAGRLAGERGANFTELAKATIRSVARGIIGIALIQSILAGLGFLAVGIPGAGFLAFLCLLLAVIQIGLGPIMIPAIIYIFVTADTLTAVLFLVWGTFVLLLDNVLRPLLLGRGVPVPMLVIFIGAIGGFLAHGIIGLFVGPVVLAVGYELIRAWVTSVPSREAPTP